MNKKGNSILGVVSVIALLLTVVVLAPDAFQNMKDWGLASLVGYDLVYKQNWGHIECVQNNDYDIVYSRYLDDVSLFKCDDYTNECYMDVAPDRSAGILGIAITYQTCDINGNNCGSKSEKSWYGAVGSGNHLTFTLPVGKSVKFSYGCSGLCKGGYDTVKAVKKAKSFYIRGVENGKVFVQESCVLDSDLRSKVPNDGLNELSKTGSNSRQNYMTDFVSVASKTYTYNGKEVICQARDLYSVDNKAFKDGSVRKLQGERITGVACCPSEANCGEDFKFHQEVNRECTYSSECSNGGQPIAETSTSAYKFSCQANSCVKSAVYQVECTNTQVCIQKYGAGSVCDLSSISWGKCIKSTKPNYCGDGICQSLDGENGNTCWDDCALDCAKGQVVKTVCSGGFLTPEVCEKRCGNSKWSIPWWGWVIIGIIAFLILIKGFKYARALLKKIPVIGWIIP